MVGCWFCWLDFDVSGVAGVVSGCLIWWLGSWILWLFLIWFWFWLSCRFDFGCFVVLNLWVLCVACIGAMLLFVLLVWWLGLELLVVWCLGLWV